MNCSFPYSFKTSRRDIRHPHVHPPRPDIILRMAVEEHARCDHCIEHEPHPALRFGRIPTIMGDPECGPSSP